MATSRKLSIRALRTMFALTTIGGGAFGIGILIAPRAMQSLFGWPGGDPIAFGVTGSVYLAFGLVSLIGFRDPVRFAPILLLQCAYKLIWLLAVYVPLLAQGAFPAYAYLHVAIFVAYAIGDLIALRGFKLKPALANDGGA